jgi:hypothetical protein
MARNPDIVSLRSRLMVQSSVWTATVSESLASAGSECAEHGFLSPHGGFYIVESDNGEIVGQSWAWRGTNDELVLDSLEHLNGRLADHQWSTILDKMSSHIATACDDITALNIGKGGKTPQLPFNDAAFNTTPQDYKGYRDSDKQYCAYKRTSSSMKIAA